MYSMLILARQIAVTLTLVWKTKSWQPNNINLSLNRVIEPSTFLMNHKFVTSVEIRLFILEIKLISTLRNDWYQSY